MNIISYTITSIREFITLGGPVVAILLMMSVLSLSLVIYKIGQFSMLGVGRRHSLELALKLHDNGTQDDVRAAIGKSRSHLKPLITTALNQALNAEDKSLLSERLAASSEHQMSRLEQGFRPLDAIAQIAPLLGLFGTVLGMIEAFRSLQDAGTSVDPSLLAGGIWVALMTTAVGLAVAMPTSLLLTWLESRVAAERVFTDKALTILLCPATALKHITPENRHAAA